MFDVFFLTSPVDARPSPAPRTAPGSAAASLRAREGVCGDPPAARRSGARWHPRHGGQLLLPLSQGDGGTAWVIWGRYGEMDVDRDG